MEPRDTKAGLVEELPRRRNFLAIARAAVCSIFAMVGPERCLKSGAYETSGTTAEFHLMRKTDGECDLRIEWLSAACTV